MQHSYLRILQGSLHAPLDYGIIMDALTSFHMVYDQILEYLQGSSENIELYPPFAVCILAYECGDGADDFYRAA